MNHVDTVSVEVNGFWPKLYVQSFELSVAVNSIPSISLNVLPVEPPPKGSGQYVTASSPTIRDITKLYSELLKKSLNLDETATMYIEVTSHNPDESTSASEKDQRIELRDWVLTDVGLSTVTPTAAPVLTVIFSHPVVKLDRTGSIYEEVANKKQLTTVFRNLGGDDPISYMDNLYKTYAAGGSVLFYDIAQKTFGGPIEDHRTRVQRFRKNLAKYLPGDFIEGGTGGFFMQNVVGDLIGNIKIATGYIERPQSFCESTWSRLVRSLCPSFLTHIVPTYDKPTLRLEPYSPWQWSTRTINVKMAVGLDVVSADPAPVIGTAINKDSGEELKVTNDANRTSESGDADGEDGTEQDFTHAFYFPDGAAKSTDLGEICNLGESRVVSYITDIDRGSNADKSANGAYGEDLEEAGNSVTDELRQKMDEAYAKAMFLTVYRKQCRATVTTTLMFKDESGNMIYPGRVLTVHDQEDHLFNGYMTRVIIRGSAEGEGSTYIEMSHARPTESGSTFVEEGTLNPCYPEEQPTD